MITTTDDVLAALTAALPYEDEAGAVALENYLAKLAENG